MAKTPFAKYKHAAHPVMREMLVGGRIKALEKTLGLIRVQLSLGPGPQRRARLEARLREMEALLARARKAKG